MNRDGEFDALRDKLPQLTCAAYICPAGDRQKMDIGIERLLCPFEHRRRQDGARGRDGAECRKRRDFGWEHITEGYPL